VKNAKNTHTKHRKTPQNTAKHRKTLYLYLKKTPTKHKKTAKHLKTPQVPQHCIVRFASKKT